MTYIGSIKCGFISHAARKSLKYARQPLQQSKETNMYEVKKLKRSTGNTDIYGNTNRYLYYMQKLYCSISLKDMDLATILM